MEQPRILIVDDEVFNLQFLTELLMHDYRISAVKDGLKALQLAEALIPDLIIMDVVMPGMDGYKVIQKLKANAAVRHIPVIFLTSLDNAKDEAKGLSLGALDYIGKPFHPAIVKARVNNIMELVKHRKLVEKIALLDGLTGIPNRRAYDDRLLNEWQRACRNQDLLSLAFLDIDYFKPYNDTYGHAAGDQALKLVARQLHQTLKRSSDFVARYGGEEFAFILPNLPQEEAVAFAESIRRRIFDLAIEHQAAGALEVLTISIGGATTAPTTDRQLTEFTRCVDRLLYRAKEKRNHVAWECFGARAPAEQLQVLPFGTPRSLTVQRD